MLKFDNLTEKNQLRSLPYDHVERVGFSRLIESNLAFLLSTLELLSQFQSSKQSHLQSIQSHFQAVLCGQLQNQILVAKCRDDNVYFVIWIFSEIEKELIDCYSAELPNLHRQISNCFAGFVDIVVEHAVDQRAIDVEVIQ